MESTQQLTQQLVQITQMSLDVQNQLLMQGRKHEELMRENLKVMKEMGKVVVQIQGKVSFIENRHMSTFMSDTEFQRLMKADEDQYNELKAENEHQKDIERHIMTYMENHDKPDQDTMALYPKQFPEALQGPQNQQKVNPRPLLT